MRSEMMIVSGTEEIQVVMYERGSRTGAGAFDAVGEGANAAVWPGILRDLIEQSQP